MVADCLPGKSGSVQESFRLLRLPVETREGMRDEHRSRVVNLSFWSLSNKCLAVMTDRSEIRSIILTVQVAFLRRRVSDSLIANRWILYTPRVVSDSGRLW